MSFTDTLIVLAMLAQGGIAMLLLLRLGTIRVPMVMRGEIDMQDIALSRQPWPEREKRVSNAFDNQFQLPVLFYVACGLALYLGGGWIAAVLAWLFVAARVVHAAIFVTWNSVPWRSLAYSTGFGFLALLWLWLIVLTIAHLGAV
jgi:hypothetical protein